MWLLVFYDLPVLTKAQRKAATGFHDFLEDEGFDRMHYSVYMRFCGSHERVETFERRIESALPPWGSVCALRLTDRQFSGIKRWAAKQPEESPGEPSQYRLL
jgi:CRISPR-associated protein Cas2